MKLYLQPRSLRVTEHIFSKAISSLLFISILSYSPALRADWSEECDLLVSSVCESSGFSSYTAYACSTPFEGYTCIACLSSNSTFIWVLPSDMCPPPDGDGGCIGCDDPPPAPPPPTNTGPNQPPMDPPMCRGSLINVEGLAVGESIELVGTPFTLNYQSDRVSGRKDIFTARIPLLESAVDGDVLLTISIAGRIFQFDHLPTNPFEFTWDGNDASGNPVLRSTSAVITQAHLPSETSYTNSLVLGHIDVTEAGLGGWTLSAHHFYDPLRKVLVGGDGVTYSAESKTLQGGQLMSASRDGSEVYVFSAQGRHLLTKHGLTGAVKYSFNYEPGGEVAQVIDGFGNVTSILRNGHKPIAIAGPFGQQTNLSTNVDGFLTSVSNPAGHAHDMTYINGGLLSSFRKPTGVKTFFEYDNTGRLVKDTSQSGSSLELSMSNMANGWLVSAKTAEGRTYRFQFESEGEMYTRGEITPSGALSVTGFNKAQKSEIIATLAGEKITTDRQDDVRFGGLAPIVAKTAITSAHNDKVFETERLQSAEITDSADPFSFVTLSSQYQVNGSLRSTDVYSSSDKTWTTSSALGRKIQVGLNSQERPVFFRFGELLPVFFTYDGHGRLLYISEGERKSVFGYDQNGFLSSFTNSLNQSTNFSRDEAGRITSQTLPDGRVIQFSYDANGNLTGLTPPGRPSHQFSYNLFEKIAAYLPPVIDGTSMQTNYEYNNDRQLTRIVRPDAQEISLKYAANTGLLEKVQIPGAAFHFEFDSRDRLNRLTKMTSPDGVTHEYQYNGSLLTRTTVQGSVNANVEYGYNNEFQIKSVGIEGSAPVTYAFDADGLLIGAGALSITRTNTSGQVSSASLLRTSESLVYNELGELLQKQVRFKDQLIYDERLTRDKLGRITERAEKRGSHNEERGRSARSFYSYDSSGRLTLARDDMKNYRQYVYDENSNRIQMNSRLGQVKGTYDAQDRMLSYGNASYTYTQNGELLEKRIKKQTTRLTYDVLGNLKSVVRPSGKRIEYLLDGQNRRVGKKVNGRLKKIFIYEDQLRIGAEFDRDENLTARFVYGTQSHVPDYMIKAGRTYKFITDHLGSVLMVIDAERGAIVQSLEYDEFGQVTHDTHPGFQPFGFAGGIYDPDTGLVRFGVRDYDGETGRWLSKDPIGFSGGDTNLYGYVLNDPINMIDPDGKVAQMILVPIISGGIGGFIGGIGGAITAPSGCGLKGFAEGAIIGGAGGFLGGVGIVTGGASGAISGIVGSLTGSALTGISGAASVLSPTCNPPPPRCEGN